MTTRLRGGCMTGFLLLLSGCGWDNRPPVANSLDLTLDEDTYAERAFPVTDEDDDSLRIEILTPPRHGTVSQADGAFAYTPAPNYNGPDSFAYRARDVWARSQPATVTITVRPVNDRPTAEDAHVTTLEDHSVTFTIAMHDIDGDATTLGSSGPAGGGVFEVLDAAAGLVRFTPDPDFNRSAVGFFQVSDGTDYAAVLADVTVTPVNDAPVAHDDVLELSHGGSFASNVTGNDTDVDQEQLFLHSVGSTPAGQVSIDGNQLRFTPNPDFIGVSTVSYEVADAAGALSTAQVRLEVRLIQALLFLADRDTSGTLELYRYDGVETRKLNLPLGAGERILDFKTGDFGMVLYRTRQNSTNHLYAADTGRFAPPAERISASSVDEYYLFGRAGYYLSGNTLYRANVAPPVAVFTPASPGESITGVIDEGTYSSPLYLSTLQFNPSLGASNVLRMLPVVPTAFAPLVTSNAPDSVTQVWFTMQPQGASRSVVYGAEAGGSRAIYVVPAAGGPGVRLSPQFGLNENFSGVQPHFFHPYVVYRGNLGSSAANVYRADLAQPGTHRQINARSSAAQELTAYYFNEGDENLFYAMSDVNGLDRRVYLSRVNQPGFAVALTPSTPGRYGAYDLTASPRELRLLYLDGATAAGPSRLMMLDNPTQAGSPVPLRDAGTILEQLRVSLSWTVAAALERTGGSNALLLVNLLAPGDVRTLYAPGAGGLGVLEARFEQH